MVITISRQFMAGGSEVAKRVADALGWTVVDDALIEAVAERSGFTPEDVKSLEESVPSFMERFAQSSALSSPENLLSTPNILEGPATVRLAHVTREVIQELGQRDGIVFVGRAAAAVLASERNAIHVRLVAPLAGRVHEAMSRLDLDEEEARVFVEGRDDDRARYHKELFGRDWNDAVNYHLVLNTELLGRAGAAELVVARARSLGWLKRDAETTP
jgi:cytidylate kinase